MTDITKLPDKWRDAEMESFGEPVVNGFSAADQLEALIPKWTKITDDPDTWPGESETVLNHVNGMLYNLEILSFEKDNVPIWMGDYWRSLCGIDSPPEEG